MRAGYWAVVGATCLLAGSPLFGAAKVPDWASTYKSLLAHIEANQCAAVIADAEQLRRAELPPEVADVMIRLADGVSIGCHYQLDQPSRGATAARAALSRAPDKLKIAGIWFESAMFADRLDDAIEALTAAVGGSQADISATLKPEATFDLLRALRRAGRQADAVAVELILARSGYGGADREIRDSLTATAVRAAIDQGDMETARALASQMVDRDALQEMLTLAPYRPIWPMLEAQVGPGMATSNALSLEAAQAEADRLGVAEQSDAAADAQARLMHALWNSGQRAQALEVGAQAFASPAALAAATERGGWLVNGHAQLLAADGRTDEAIRRFDSLTDLGISERPWLISMRINRAMLLSAHGRHDQLLSGIEALSVDARTYGNGYAQQLVREQQLCSLAGAGRMAEASARRPELLKAQADAAYATARALLCLGDQQAASQIMLKALQDRRTAEAAVANLQPLTRADDPKSRLLRPVLTTPEVAAAYAKVGRDLPENLR